MDEIINIGQANEENKIDHEIQLVLEPQEVVIDTENMDQDPDTNHSQGKVETEEDKFVSTVIPPNSRFGGLENNRNHEFRCL